MGGGISDHRLASAVSDAGGLGTIAVPGATAIAAELARARELTDCPVAVNLLLPFARRSWFEAAAAADVVVTFWGKPRRRTPGVWLHQAGSVQEAVAAHAAGADGVIVQGVEAGGHVRGTVPALDLLERVRSRVPSDFPLLLAGGIAERGDVREAIDAGASAAVAGTRFLLSEESRAHPAYKQRLIEADETLLTDLFGAGWAGSHRVVPNAATVHWLGGGRSTPRLNKGLNRLLGLGARYTPGAVQSRLAATQRPTGRLLGPMPPLAGGASNLLEAGPLYAGETVRRIDGIRPAADLVAELSP
jgi:NAD(P)H-dependent flavin oxidoreductase YrpB (nitropropane dioxygenase family)